MVWLAAAVISAIVFGFSGFLMKVGSQNGHSPRLLLFGLYASGTLAFAVSLSMQGAWGISSLVLLGGVIIGLGSAVGNNYMVRALAMGPASLTSPLINLNVLLVVLVSVIFYHESLSIQESLAIVLFLLACVLIPFDPKADMTIKSNKWYSFIFLSVVFVFLRNGGLKVTQELDLNNTLVLFYAYFLSLAFFSGQFLIKEETSSKSMQGLYIGALAGLFSYGGLELYSYALKTGPASIVAPIFSLRSIVMVAMAVWIYKERLTVFQVGSLVSLLTGLVLISN